VPILFLFPFIPIFPLSKSPVDHIVKLLAMAAAERALMNFPLTAGVSWVSTLVRTQVIADQAYIPGALSGLYSIFHPHHSHILPWAFV